MPHRKRFLAEPETTWAAEMHANMRVQEQAREDIPPKCCARCRRGTPALLGPCGYNGACPKECHTKGMS